MEEQTAEIERMMGDLRRVVARFDDLSQRSHYASHPRKVYQAISHSLIGEAVFEAQDYTWQALARAFRPGMGQHLPDRLFWARENAGGTGAK